MPLMTVLMMLQAATPVPVPAVVAVSEKKVCRRMDMTGSIIPFRRVCQTRAEWLKFDQASNEAWETARNSKNRSWSQSAPTN